MKCLSILRKIKKNKISKKNDENILQSILKNSKIGEKNSNKNKKIVRFSSNNQIYYYNPKLYEKKNSKDKCLFCKIF